MARFSASFPRGERHACISPLIECLIGDRGDDLNPRSGYARHAAWDEDSASARVPVRGIVWVTASAYRQNRKGVAAWPRPHAMPQSTTDTRLTSSWVASLPW